MWKCPNCKMTNDTYKCKNCGLDESKAYTHHRTITWLTQDSRKVYKPNRSNDKTQRKTELVSPSTVRQVPVQPGNPSGKMIAEQVGKIPREQERKQYALAVQELAALGEDQYQLKIWEDETIDPDIKTGIVPHEWLSFAAIAGNREAQLQLSEDYREASAKNEACFWLERAKTRFFVPEGAASHRKELDTIYPDARLTADQEYQIALDYDLKIRRAVSKLNPLLKDGLTREEFRYQKKTAEEKRNEWIRKAAEHGSMEAQYYLAVLLYPDPDYYKTGDKDATEQLIYLEEDHKAGSYGDAVLWLLKAEAQGYLPAKNLMLQLGKEISEERDRFNQQKEKEKNAGLLKKILGKKTAEKPVKEEFKIPALSLARPFHPGFIGLCHLADAGVSEAQMFAAKEYEKSNGNAEGFAWYLESAAWSGNTEAMELLSRCYAEGKGTEKDLAKASFWYERAVRRGTPTMEDPAKNLDEKEKQKLLSSEQKHILELDDVVKAYDMVKE